MQPGEAITMSPLSPSAPRPSRDIIDRAIARHGAGRVLLAAALSLLRPRSRPPDLGALSDHLRRDIGLPARDAPRHLPRFPP